MAQTDQIRKGMYMLYNNEPHYITEAEFYSPGKGSALTRLKVKNLATGKVIPVTYKSGERVEELDVRITDMQFLYNDDTSMYFMDPKTYEQLTMSKKVGEQYLKYMKEGEEYVAIIHDNAIINLKFPAQVILKITDTQPGVKGDTANNALKEAIIETGHKIMVPLFTQIGDQVKIDPETGAYMGRLSK